MANKTDLRVVDTGINRGRYNISVDSALIEAKRLGLTPDTLRFLEFSPSALIGRHQDLSQEIDVRYCVENNIDIGRRLTGGGALYLDQQQLGWELICSRRKFSDKSLRQIASVICNAVTIGLSKIGVDAKFRGRNDIEFDGRKIGGTGGFFDGDVLFYQGTLLLGLNTKQMFKVLRNPDEKHMRHGLRLSAERVTSLEDILGKEVPSLDRIKTEIRNGITESLGFSYQAGDLSDFEKSKASEVFIEEIGQDDFVYSIDHSPEEDGWSKFSRTTAGGTVSIYVKIETYGLPRISNIMFTGDFFITPPRAIYDLECHLKQVPIRKITDSVTQFFDEYNVEMMSVPLDQFVDTIKEAVS